MRRIALSLLCLALPCMAQTSRPASRPAATQPASLYRYWNLVRSDFAKDPAGRVVPAPSDLRAAIVAIRQQAADERADLEAQIDELSRQIRTDEQSRKDQEHAAREASDNARHAQRASRTVTMSRTGKLAEGTRVQSHYDPRAARAAKDAAGRADEASKLAAQSEGKVGDNRAEMLRLKRESAARAWAASPWVLAVPPRPFWPDEHADALKRVGITQDDLRAYLPTVGLTEASFVAAARNLDRATGDPARLRDGLLKLLTPATSRPGPRG